MSDLAAAVERVRPICLGLPETYEEEAWTGTRWRVRGKTFAHVLAVEEGWPPVYAAAVGSDGPMVVLMFRSDGPELDALRNGGPPWFGPPWRADEVGLVLGDPVDWDEITELLTDSYCTQAPKKLAARVQRPT